MPQIGLDVKSEYGIMTDVLLATVRNFVPTPPINRTQEVYFPNNPPILSRLTDEQNTFAATLEQNGVTVHWAKEIQECPYQVNTRDLGAVIGNTFLIGNFRRPIRQNEIRGIENLLAEIDGNILRCPKDGFFEGGDLLIDKTTLYVGIGERTDQQGYKFLLEQFGKDYEVIPLPLNAGILHLDTVFNIVADNTCLVFVPGFKSEGLEFFEKRFRSVLQITEQEQFDLSSNVMSIGTGKIISSIKNTRVNQFLNQQGFNLIELDFEHTIKIGGAFRCATLPLRRIENTSDVNSKGIKAGKTEHQ